MKFRISWLWLPFLLVLYDYNLTKTILLMFFMLSIHEGAHMLVAHLFHYPIEEVIVYPFGLCAKMKYIGLGNVFYEMLIIGAGPFTHVFFPFIFAFLLSCNFISQAYYEYLCMLNMSILVFNLLPIYPLDGGRIMQSLYHMVFRYTTAQKFTLLTSILNIYLLFHYRIMNTVSAYFAMGFLLLQILVGWKQIASSRLQFYHYRKNHPVNFPTRFNKSHDFYRSWSNMLKCEKGWISEEEWLRYYFLETEKAYTYTLIL